ncbi:DMT family transporter [Caedibacter taeniospiralis]|uniref:DMT family transporter n=1 Tax=Caedibacter taeniospiralis TaxID=28907 RepID=UPI0013027FBB|nr:DMT family transporter [Caedibacter taeniospiralis]
MGIIIGIISGMLWGLNDVLTNVYSEQGLFSSATFAVLVFALVLSLMQDGFSCAGIYTYHHVRGSFKENLAKTRHKNFWPLVVAAICAGPLGMVTGIMGIAYAGPVYAGVVTSCYPVVALLLAMTLLREKATKLKILGIVLTVIGVMFISITGVRSGAEHIVIGLIFASCAMLGWGAESILFSIAQKTTTQDVSWLLAIRQSVSSLSYLVILSFLLLFDYQQTWQVISQLFLPLLIVGCVLSASSSYLAYYHAIKRIGASLGTTFNASFIFWAGIFSVMFNITEVQRSFILWSIVLIFGIYFASKGNKNFAQVAC